MKLAGFAGVLAALGIGCLEAPPTGSAPDGGSGSDGGAPPLLFPPAGASVHLTAAIAADVDGDEREDLVLLDDDVDDDFAGLYVLRAGEAGWAGLAEVRLDFRPKSIRFGRDVGPATPALVVGGTSGRIATVDYKPEDDSFEVIELALDPPAEGSVALIHTGRMAASDPAASLFVDDGTSLYLSNPIDRGAPIALSSLAAGDVLDLAFWPLDSSGAVDFYAWRRETRIEWQHKDDYGSAMVGDLVAAHFVHLDADLCGTYLGIDSDGGLVGGWIRCDRGDGGIAPVEAYLVSQVTAVAAGDLAGGSKHDIALIGMEGQTLVGQVLIDIDLIQDGTDFFVPEDLTDTLPLDGVVPEDAFLTPVDAEGDGTAFLFAVGPAGALFCGEVVGEVIERCASGWTVSER